MFFLYRGELHKVSGIPRRWPLPQPTISLSAFRQALEKRNDALRSIFATPRFTTSCLTRQETCVSGSQNVSPTHVHAIEGPREDPETDIGREGRGESDGQVKEDYMDEDIDDAGEDGEDRNMQGRKTRHGSYEEGHRDGSIPMEDSSAPTLSRDHSLDNNKPRREPKPECTDVADMEDHVDCKERKKRKREEAPPIEAKKGRVKVKEEVVATGAPVAVEPAALDAVAREVMELDQKVVENEAGDRGNLENDSTEKEGPHGNPELALIVKEGDGQTEVNHDEERDFVKVEAPSTPPVHSEELNIGKPTEGKEQAGEAKVTEDAAGGKKAELEAKLEKLTAEKHHLVQMLKQVLSTEKVSKKKVQSATQSLSAPGPSSAPGLLSASQDVPSSTDVPAAPVVHSETASAAGAEVTPKVDVHTASRHSQVRSHKLGRQLNASRLVQVLSTEEESKKKTHNASQTSPTPGLPFASQAASISAEVPSAPVVQLETANAGGGEVQASADLEEGELEYARTPSPPPSHATIASHPASHGTHSSHGATPALGPLLGRQPQHLNQGGSARGGYYPQGLGLPSPSSAAAAALVGAISPGTGYMPLVNRPYQHQMVMQHAAAAAALHAQKVAAAAAAAGHSHMSPILGGGGPAGSGNGISNGPPGFGSYGVPPAVHGHHMPQGASPGASHIAAQQGASPSLLTTPRGAPYHDVRNLNPAWNLQR
ncbi:uncharacterized protein [Physcomitrium patens]|uniref:Uncharacterized protein n=1 Tax=Physcomitrium patens TaxID=3218 RepID=A0A2K1KZT0_PHYPA|nr:uncharacterized protein LOC112278711 isoform X1 [Physcomitrium patens]XP_024368128.1 uncharacterized protein LOC112278711 isoform X1 [Physcomitrium patens]XP_024368129.1 uncharacterized protein LOC112278711 isoform X1 [Physcomitrium patens]XP_024368130.1 uncharacterized protein LOC112278711 isoform X1 [Physcomitrium patens]PNR59295.1 hypothetical protein PHYPA_002086 [Physcomitrium patens]|eukprot:XP_024368127.1 uncharacterized protein LOC112278711 isoform X1 [Physcomitrella patens]